VTSCDASCIARHPASRHRQGFGPTFASGQAVFTRNVSSILVQVFSNGIARPLPSETGKHNLRWNKTGNTRARSESSWHSRCNAIAHTVYVPLACRKDFDLQREWAHDNLDSNNCSTNSLMHVKLSAIRGAEKSHSFQRPKVQSTGKIKRVHALQLCGGKNHARFDTTWLRPIVTLE